MSKGMQITMCALGAIVCFFLACGSGLAGCVSLLAEHPDPKTGHIVGAQQSPYIFGFGALASIGFTALGIVLIIRATKLKP